MFYQLSLAPTFAMLPDLVDRLFPIEVQRSYIALIQRRGGLTRRKAEYFVRLWAYLLLKQQEELHGGIPTRLKELRAPEGLVNCTHREAAELFYRDQEKGSDRAAGMMIDRLAALGLLDKQYDGNSLALKIRTFPEIELPPSEEPVELFADMFNPRTDAITISTLYTKNYAPMIRDGAAMAKLAKVLRLWSQQYGKGMRVLRRSDNHNVVAACVLYPVAAESDQYFFQQPSKSFYLTTDNPVDPFIMAQPGDKTCVSIYIRAWVIDQPYLTITSLCQLLEDTQQTLIKMREDYPESCDLYTLIVHPIYEELRRILGFERICEDSQRSFAWIHGAIDRFLETDMQRALSNLRIGDASQ
ncbi:hypothetical protein LBWT_33190 [Leptolyngbya boryana IAM M-101]|nr:hypothetical protein LBWT_33190 [Leptolyngbya boryana IAM M-101]BAS63712.1 hypothetical protein LBDG_33190 [Leptolyngbya boryana dg5]